MEGFCTRCGDCCENIVFDFSIDDMLKRIEDAWILLDLSDSTDDEISWAKKNLYDMTFVLENWIKNSRGTWKCKQFNSETRLCEAGDNRPPVCQGYPWYGKLPGEEHRSISLKCGYWYDLSQEEWPERIKLLPLLDNQVGVC